MLVEIRKTEMREIALTDVRYVSFCDTIFYRFTPVNNKIEILRYDVTNTNSFELNARKEIFDHELSILEVTREYAKEISEDEFNTKLQELLLKYI